MALNIKNREVERLATEVAGMAGETKTEAIRRALLDRRQRLAIRRTDTSRGRRLRAWLENEVWPSIPPDVFGRRLSKEEEEAILGYGPGGF
ncbi:MAG: protein transcription factor [Acidobacteria bacterium]|nr:protein transcription factor [Acidobacteriota bacterium]